MTSATHGSSDSFGTKLHLCSQPVVSTTQQSQIICGVAAAERPGRFVMKLQERSLLAASSVGPHVTTAFAVPLRDESTHLVLQMATLAGAKPGVVSSSPCHTGNGG